MSEALKSHRTKQTRRMVTDDTFVIATDPGNGVAYPNSANTTALAYQNQRRGLAWERAALTIGDRIETALSNKVVVGVLPTWSISVTLSARSSTLAPSKAGGISSRSMDLAL